MPNNPTPYGPGEGGIFMDNVYCDTSAMSLAACSHVGWNAHNCYHSEDVAIECSVPSTIGKCARFQLGKLDLQSLDFIFNRLCINILKTGSIDVYIHCVSKNRQ